MEQRSEEWFRARAGRITASNINKILTPTGKLSKQAEDYIFELCAACVRPDEISFEGNMHTDRGELLEPEACELFTERKGFDVRKVGFITRADCPVLGCSPDRLIYVDGKPDGGLEVKCPLGKKHARWLFEGILPDEHKNQVHASMVVTGLPYWYFMSYCLGFEPFIIKVLRDDYTDKLEEIMIPFAAQYLKTREIILPILTGEAA